MGAVIAAPSRIVVIAVKIVGISGREPDDRLQEVSCGCHGMGVGVQNRKLSVWSASDHASSATKRKKRACFESVLFGGLGCFETQRINMERVNLLYHILT